MNLKIKAFDALIIILVFTALLVAFKVLKELNLIRPEESPVIVLVRLNNQPPWVDAAIKAGDGEFSVKKKIATILEKNAVTTQAASEFELQWLKPAYKDGRPKGVILDLPVYKDNLDITLRVRILARKNDLGELEFKNHVVKVNEAIEIKTEKINIQGIVMAFDKE